MQQQKRRSVRLWIAGILGLQAHIDAQERRALVESGFRMGIAHATGKPANVRYSDYPPVLAASARLLAPPPPVTSHEHEITAYEPPDRHTGPVRKLASPEQMRAFLDTRSLPAVPPPGEVARIWHKKHSLPRNTPPAGK